VEKYYLDPGLVTFLAQFVVPSFRSAVSLIAEHLFWLIFVHRLVSEISFETVTSE